MSHVHRNGKTCTCEWCGHGLDHGIIHVDPDCPLHVMVGGRIENRDDVSFTLTEIDICALMRQLYRQPITHEGTSGPRVHDLYRRLQEHIGPERYHEFVSGPWPERLTESST